jgi:hypothetical protein
MIIGTLSIDKHGALALATIQTCPTFCRQGRETIDPLAQQNLRVLTLYQPASLGKGNKMMTMMMKTIVLSLGVLASAVTAVEDNVMEFGRFHVLEERSRSGWMRNKMIIRRDEALLQKAKPSVDE